jgi:hypothetical protein
MKITDGTVIARFSRIHPSALSNFWLKNFKLTLIPTAAVLLVHGCMKRVYQQWQNEYRQQYGRCNRFLGFLHQVECVH